MKSIHQVGVVSFNWVLMIALFGTRAFAQEAQPVEQAAPGAPSMVGGSPMTDFVSGAVIQVLIIAVLVVALIGGAFLVLNLGLLSKRPEDHTGERNPSDIDFMSHDRFPDVPLEESILPAQDPIQNVNPEQDPVVVVTKNKGPTRAA